MKLSECTMYRYVKIDPSRGVAEYLNVNRVGYVKDLSENPCGEPLVTVKWQCGAELDIHPINLIPYEE